MTDEPKYPQPSHEQKKAIVKFLRQTSMMRVIEKKRKEAEEKEDPAKKTEE